MALLVELADEFGLTTFQSVQLCRALGAAADDLGAELDDGVVAEFRAAVPVLVAAGVLDTDPDHLRSAIQAALAPPPAPVPATVAPTPFAPPPPPPPPEMRSTPGPALLDELRAHPLPVIGVAVLLVVVIAVVAIGSLSGPGSDDTAEAGTEPAGRLVVDECFDLPPDLDDAARPLVESVHPRACADPHDAELYAEVRTYLGRFMSEHDGYPGTEALVVDAISECLYRFERFVGVPYRGSGFDVIALVPPEAQWSDPASRVSRCGLAHPDGEKLEGSRRTPGPVSESDEQPDTASDPDSEES